MCSSDLKVVNGFPYYQQVWKMLAIAWRVSFPDEILENDLMSVRKEENFKILRNDLKK